MKLWEMLEPSFDVVVVLEENLKKMDVSMALTETALKFKISIREVIDAAKVKALNEFAETDPRRAILVKRK